MPLSYKPLLKHSRGRCVGLLLSGWLLGAGGPAAGQSLRKLEHQAVNRTHLTFVNGDTVQRFTITSVRPTPRPGRFYYWQGPTQILRTAGAYDGRLLTGAYRLTSRNGNLLGAGTFKNGLKTGLWRTWRADGTPLASSRWRQGRLRGTPQVYDEAGQLRRPASPPVAAGTTVAKVRVWQPAYWKALAKRVKLPRWHKRASPPPGPGLPPASGPAGRPVPASAAPAGS